MTHREFLLGAVNEARAKGLTINVCQVTLADYDALVAELEPFAVFASGRSLDRRPCRGLVLDGVFFTAGGGT